MTHLQAVLLGYSMYTVGRGAGGGGGTGELGLVGVCACVA
jgi:hypothetical protein